MKLKAAMAILFALASTLSVAGSTLLTVTGPDVNTGETITHTFDRAAIDGLTQYTITTNTPWYDNSSNFEGPRFTDVLNAAGIKGNAFKVSALNDYSATLPLEDIEKYSVILATKLNGETLRVRDKGPLFVMFPFDDFPEIQTEANYGRSVWQVKSIEAVE